MSVWTESANEETGAGGDSCSSPAHRKCLDSDSSSTAAESDNFLNVSQQTRTVWPTSDADLCSKGPVHISQILGSEDSSPHLELDPEHGLTVERSMLLEASLSDNDSSDDLQCFDIEHEFELLGEARPSANQSEKLKTAGDLAVELMDLRQENAWLKADKEHAEEEVWSLRAEAARNQETSTEHEFPAPALGFQKVQQAQTNTVDEVRSLRQDMARMMKVAARVGKGQEEAARPKHVAAELQKVRKAQQRAESEVRHLREEVARLKDAAKEFRKAQETQVIARDEVQPLWDNMARMKQAAAEFTKSQGDSAEDGVQPLLHKAAWPKDMAAECWKVGDAQRNAADEALCLREAMGLPQNMPALFRKVREVQVSAADEVRSLRERVSLMKDAALRLGASYEECPKDEIRALCEEARLKGMAAEVHKELETQDMPRSGSTGGRPKASAPHFYQRTDSFTVFTCTTMDNKKVQGRTGTQAAKGTPGLEAKLQHALKSLTPSPVQPTKTVKQPPPNGVPQEMESELMQALRSRREKIERNELA